MSYYLFIFLSHQHIQHMASQILLILIDFLAFLYTVITLELEEKVRNGKRRSF